MAHVLNMEALEVGLMARKAQEGRGAHLFVTKKKRRWPNSGMRMGMLPLVV